MAPPPPRANAAENKPSVDKERVTQADGAKQQRREKPLSHDTGNTKGAVATELGGKFAPDRRGSVFDNTRVEDNAEDARSEAEPPKTPAGPTSSLKKKPEPSAAKPSDDPVTTATADAIRDEVRFHYLRTTLDLYYLRGSFRVRTHDQAVRFLLGKNTDCKLPFRTSGLTGGPHASLRRRQMLRLVLLSGASSGMRTAIASYSS
jgi:hypothetical protein